MPIFYSKPAEIEAWLYNGTLESRYLMLEILGDNGRVDEGHTSAPQLMVNTANGWVELCPDHHLIKGVRDYYPCDATTFDVRWSATPPVQVSQ